MTTRSTRSPRRRTVVALAVVLAILSAFVVRLVDIQVVNAREHIDDSLALGFAGAQTLYGARGAIVDENGATLAGSILLYDAQLDPMLAKDGVTRTGDDGERIEVSWADLASQMAQVTGQTAEEVEKVVTDALAENPGSRFAYLKRGITTEQFRALADLGVPFLTFVPHPARTYPDGAVGGNLVGFVGTDGAPLAGLEKAQNDCLSSTNGTRTYQRGKDGVILPGTQVDEPAVDGGTLQLTVNRDLTWYLTQLIAEQAQNVGAKSGTITVVEAKTGKVRAAAEWPTVDPNNFEASISDDRYSRIFSGSFEPGSTFKALTAAIAIDAGGKNPGSTVTAASRETFPNGATVRDPSAHPTNNYTLTGVLIDSSNVGISKFGESVSAQTRYDYLKKFGISQGGNFGLGSAVGELRTPDQWDNQTFYNTNFGQGLTTTVPELVGAYQTIANGGLRMPLSIVEGCTASDGTVSETPDSAGEQVVAEKTADDVSLMLENVATQGGLAKSIAIPGYRLAVKTGTGEKPDLVNGGYKSGAFFTTMIGFAPAEDPQYIVAVTLDEPVTVKSSAANAPAFQKAMTQVLKTYRVMPSESGTPELPKFG
ncbi:peptidoglycan D,D-transpeptidase FtsI family protein [Microbacterium sp. P06]|uniref:peptidoglycan D,D-transpeptidase FtsI family protein n=1 Tax=Microbacterium sp. P06 TaxID=3366949 RepID=UPI00374562F2